MSANTNTDNPCRQKGTDGGGDILWCTNTNQPCLYYDKAGQRSCLPKKDGKCPTGATDCSPPSPAPAPTSCIVYYEDYLNPQDSSSPHGDCYCKDNHTAVIDGHELTCSSDEVCGNTPVQGGQRSELKCYKTVYDLTNYDGRYPKCANGFVRHADCFWMGEPSAGDGTSCHMQDDYEASTSWNKLCREGYSPHHLTDMNDRPEDCINYVTLLNDENEDEDLCCKRNNDPLPQTKCTDENKTFCTKCNNTATCCEKECCGGDTACELTVAGDVGKDGICTLH